MNIFDDEDKQLLCEFCNRYKIQLSYLYSSKPYFLNYTEYCCLEYQYKSRRMRWKDTNYIHASITKLKERPFHYVLTAELPDVSYTTNECGQRSRPEPHSIRKFQMCCMMLIELLNDDGIRNPHSLSKANEYHRLLHDIKTNFIMPRLWSKYADKKMVNGEQLNIL